MSELALRIIRENIKKHERGEDATTLDLGSCGLTEVLEEILVCVWVEDLNFARRWSDWDGKVWQERKTQNTGELNNISQLPASFSRLKNLKKLQVCGHENQKFDLSDLSIISELSNLQELGFWRTMVSDLSPLLRLLNLQILSYSSTQVSDLSPLAGLTSLQILSYSSTQVSDLSPLAGLTGLQILDCAETQVSDLAPLAGLTNLQQLYFDETQVSDLSPLAGLTSLQKLNCSKTQIADLSPLGGLISLQMLSCYKTQIVDLIPLIGLANLQELYFSGTQVANLSPLTGLTNLQKLNCDSTQVADLSALVGLTNLQELSCDSTQVTDLSALVGLTNLQELSCDSTQVADLAPLAGLTNLQELSCDSTQVTDLSPLLSLSNLQRFDCRGTQVADLSPLAGLTNLQELYCFSTQVADLSALVGLTNLQKLSCSFTQVADLSPLAGMTNLQLLSCPSTQVADLSPILFLIEKNVPVKWQNWSDAHEEDNSFSEKPVILVKGCPLTNPPVEVAKQGNEAILRYFEEKARLETTHGIQAVNIKVREAKVLLVGQGKSGKTSLRYKLENPEAALPEPGDTTRGIEITRLNEKMPHTGEALRLNLWDFGGQDVQHYAHQFFLTGSSLYALVTNERIQDNVHLPYWLNIIEMLGKKSPVILIQNKDGGHCQALKDEAAIRARFGNVHNRVFQSDFSQAKSEPEFALLRNKIVELASELPHIEREYLSSFNDLRQKLEAEADRETHYLVWGDYLKLMPELGADLMRDYANALTFLGVCQYFPEDAMLREYVFLRPKWLIDALFELLLHPSLDDTRGLFSENNTLEIWKGAEYDGMHGLLVRMMKQFELCYRVDGDEEKFIVPQRLPGEKNAYGWDPKDNTPVQYRYKFMPKGILTRLICRLHTRIEKDTLLGQRVWNDAVIFTLPNGKGRVFAREVYSENIIELRAIGEKHDEILNQVIQTMDDINRDISEKYDNLQWEKMVPCPCEECAGKESGERFFFKFNVLEKAIDKRIPGLLCDNSMETIPIDEIFGKSGVKKPITRRREMGRFGGKGKMQQGSDFGQSDFGAMSRPAALKIFISYSKHDRDDFLIPMTRYLKPLMLGGLLETWDDSQILPGEEWDEKIKSEIEKADVIFLLVSTNSLNTEYIWNVEIEAAMRRHEAGSARVIPIILSKCLWTEKDQGGESIFPPAKLNALPAKGKPIDEWERENHAWDAVAEGVKAILKELN
ncbi:MAG: leucine-rich repeat domain-containing protein [Saprospiraceae bacterium]